MTQQMTNRENPVRTNGLDMEALVGTVAAVKQDPSLGHFEFRGTNRWVDGGENRSRIKEFYGAGSEDESRTEAFEFTNGEPPVLLGANEDANPVDHDVEGVYQALVTTAAGLVIGITAVIFYSVFRGRVQKYIAELEAAQAESLTPASDEKQGPPNRRNGRSRKTVQGDVGGVTLNTPRDRDGTFEPQIVGKHQRRVPGFDEKILALYAKE